MGFGGRKHGQGDTNEEGDDNRDEGEFEGDRKRVSGQLQHAVIGARRVAQVTGDHSANPGEKLPNEWFVETVVRLECGSLGRGEGGSFGSKTRDYLVAGQCSEHDEHEDCDTTDGAERGEGSPHETVSQQVW